MALSFNQTHTKIAFDGERQFAFSGFKQVFFKGECSRWKIIFKYAGEEQHKEKDTINVRGANVENLHLLRIESENNYFPEIFLTTKNMQEVQMFGMEKGEEFAITSIKTMEEKEIEKKADILLERGGIHAIKFATTSTGIGKTRRETGNIYPPPTYTISMGLATRDSGETPISSLTPVNGVYYGTNIVIDRSDICPLVVDAGTIRVPLALVCTGADEIRFISCNVIVDPAGSITTDRAPITFDCANSLTVPLNNFGHLLEGSINTNDAFLVSGDQLVIANSRVFANSAMITVTTTSNSNSFEMSLTDVNIITNLTIQATAQGAYTSLLFSENTIQVNGRTEIRAITQDGTGVIFNSNTLRLNILTLDASGGVGVSWENCDLLQSSIVSISANGTIIGAYFTCLGSFPCHLNSIQNFLASGPTYAIFIMGALNVTTLPNPTITANGDVYLAPSANFTLSTDGSGNVAFIPSASGLFLRPGARFSYLATIWISSPVAAGATCITTTRNSVVEALSSDSIIICRATTGLNALASIFIGVYVYLDGVTNNYLENLVFDTSTLIVYLCGPVVLGPSNVIVLRGSNY